MSNPLLSRRGWQVYYWANVVTIAIAIGAAILDGDCAADVKAAQVELCNGRSSVKATVLILAVPCALASFVTAVAFDYATGRGMFVAADWVDPDRPA